jgi:hypothetical protein
MFIINITIIISGGVFCLSQLFLLTLKVKDYLLDKENFYFLSLANKDNYLKLQNKIEAMQRQQNQMDYTCIEIKNIVEKLKNDIND